MARVSINVIDRKNYAAVRMIHSEDDPEGGQERDFSSDPAIARLLERPKNTVVNCGGINALTEDAEQSISFLHQQLSQAGKKLHLIFVSEKLKQKLADSSLCGSIPTAQNLSSALKDFGDPTPGFSNVQFIRAFINSTLRTLYVQAKTRCKRGRIYLRSTDRSHLLGDVSGVIKASSPIFSYAMILGFPQETFLKLMSRMLGQDCAEITPEIQDGAAELINIIHSQAKRVLNEKGAGLDSEIPILHLGREFQGISFSGDPDALIPLETGKLVVVPFECDLGEFFVEVWFPEDVLPSWL